METMKNYMKMACERVLCNDLFYLPGEEKKEDDVKEKEWRFR